MPHAEGDASKHDVLRGPGAASDGAAVRGAETVREPLERWLMGGGRSEHGVRCNTIT